MESYKKRTLYELIINQLFFDGFNSIGNELAEASMIRIDDKKEVDGDKLWKLLQGSIYKERGKLGSNNINDNSGNEIMEKEDQSNLTDFDSQSPNILDFDTEASKGVALNYVTKFITTHKQACRVAKFSPDGKLAATGSEDASIKLLDVGKMKVFNQTKSDVGDDSAPIKPVIRTFYDHTQGVNDVDFHPSLPILASSSKDFTIRFYDFSQVSMKRSFLYFRDSHNVRSIHFHPSGDYLLAGTDHTLVHLYDVHTSQCFTVSPLPAENYHLAPINQVRYSSEGNIFASCSKDGTIKLWDAVSNKVLNTFAKPHSGYEVTTVQFSKNHKYLLSGGKDGVIRIWELSTGKQLQQIVTSAPWKNRLSISFTFNEDYVITSEEGSSSGMIWNVKTGELSQRLTGHTNIIKSVACSPIEPALMTCSNDHRARFWLLQNEE